MEEESLSMGNYSNVKNKQNRDKSCQEELLLHQLHSRLDEPQSRCGQDGHRKILATTGNGTRTVQHVTCHCTEVTPQILHINVFWS